MGENSSKKQFAYESIKEKILNSEYKMGEPIVERKLCEELGISRTPVRAAFSVLANEGLVDVIEDRGVFVAHIRFEDMIELYEVREALECMSVSLLAERADNDDINLLQGIIERMNPADGKQFMVLDMELHTAMAKCSKNKRLAQSIQQIYAPIRLIAASAQNDSALCATALEEHRKIVQAVSHHDSEASADMMRQHIRSVKGYHVKRYFIFSST